MEFREVEMEFSEVERSIEFLLAQQAQFMTDLQHSRELSDQRHVEISRAIVGLSAMGGVLAENDRQLGLRMADMAAAQKDLHETMNELATSQTALMLTVERHLREDHGDARPS